MMSQVQQITRDLKPNSFLEPNQVPVCKDWAWVCQAMASRGNDMPCEAKILDTIHVSEGQMQSWLFTSAKGVVQRRSEKHLTPQAVKEALEHIAMGFPNNKKKSILVAYYDTGAVKIVNLNEVGEFLSRIPIEVTCFQAYADPKGGFPPLGGYANYELEYRMDGDGKPRTKGHKVTAVQQGELERVPNMAARVNSRMTEIVKSVVSAVENCHKVRVTYVDAEFLLDGEGMVHLCRTRTFEVATLTNSSQSSSPPMKQQSPGKEAPGRISIFLSSEVEKRERMAYAASPTSDPRSKGTPLTHMAEGFPLSSDHIPSNIEERIRRRGEKNSTLVPDEGLVAKIMQENGRLSASRKPSEGGESFSPTAPAKSLSSPSRHRGDQSSRYIDVQRQKRLQAAELLGSTQINGCAGDFCHYDLKLDADGAQKDLHLGIKTKISEARLKRIMGDSNMERHVRGAVGADIRDERALSGSETFKIPFKDIVQARQEKNLVDLLLRRYERKEKGDYLSEDAEDSTLAEEFPGVYYQQVAICRNCFAVYDMIEEAREQARAKIQASKKGKKDKDSERFGVGKSSEQETQAALDRAALSLAKLNKGEIAELRSFKNPPPAVSMVATVLLLMLGEREDVVGWPEARKKLANGEKFLALLSSFEVQGLTEKKLRLIEPYVRNPRFNPAAIEPISHCAAKLSAWITNVLEAYAWSHGKGHERLKHLAAFLQDSREELEKGPSGPPDNLFPPISRMTIKPEGETGRPVAPNNEEVKQKKAVDAAKRNAQKNFMEKLAAVPGGETGSSVWVPKLFTCADGATVLPYIILGSPDFSGQACSLVVVHDFFDTLESTLVFLKPLSTAFAGCQILAYNYPAQADTKFDASLSGEKMNNQWQADRLLELISHIHTKGEMPILQLPFHLVGIGNGANIASCFAAQNVCADGLKSSDPTTNDVKPNLQSLHNLRICLRSSMKSLILLNGFARVDAQLAAILHSSINVFGCLSNKRPDLPISFFSKFIFSDDYLQRVDKNLALNIYTAITNPITLEGRIRVCKSALHGVDMRKQLPKISCPILALQATDNLLISASNVDPFVEGRAALHEWSYGEQEKEAAGGAGRKQGGSDEAGRITVKAKEKVTEVLKRPHGTFVLWMKGGHEIRQERKKEVLDFLGAVLEASSSSSLNSKLDRLGRTEELPKEDSEIPSESLSPPSPVTSPGLPSALSDVLSSGQESSLQDSAKQEADAGSKVEVNDIGLRDSHAVPPLPSILLAPPSPARSIYADEEIENRKNFIESIIKEREQLQVEIEREKEVKAKDLLVEEEDQYIRRLKEEQERRRKQWAEEDAAKIRALELEMSNRKQTRREVFEVIERTVQRVDQDIHGTNIKTLVSMGAQPRDADDFLRGEEVKKKEMSSNSFSPEPRPSSPPTLALPMAATFLSAPRPQGGETKVVAPTQALYSSTPIMERPQPLEPPTLFPKRLELSNIFDQMEKEEAEMSRLGILKIEEYEKVKQEMMQANQERKRHMALLAAQEKERHQSYCCTRIQAAYRGYMGRKRCQELRRQKEREEQEQEAAHTLCRIGRGYLGRKRAKRLREKQRKEQRENDAAVNIEKVYRGHRGRERARLKRKDKASRVIQRIFRGHLGRKDAKREWNRQKLAIVQDESATKIQATYRMKRERDRYRERRILEMAATEVQRIYRGHLGRKRATRQREWQHTPPGPERLSLGLRMIEESKLAFQRQQEEIDALHRSQEQAEDRVSQIHLSLKDSEKELSVLEQELREIDQIERDLQAMTQEQEQKMAQGGGRSLSQNSDSNKSPQKPQTPGQRGGRAEQESYALELAIQLKRAERERKKRELEAQFTSVYGEVESKKNALQALEERIADMEATRIRKEREFGRLQKNLMELLEEQKRELDSLREKGIELETATATSAAAAAATAVRAQENEKKSQAIFQSTEELMKFQFMSMSLSYMSSMNMLKNLRQINSDTTNSAVSSSAETAAAAAAAAAAANIPRAKNKNVEALMEAKEMSQKKREKELEKKKKEAEEARKALEQDFPAQVKDWTVEDVGRWLDTLSLSQYKQAFTEASVDGEFLLELRAEDMRDVLGVEHKLHVRKILVALDKMRPLSVKEKAQKAELEQEQQSAELREKAKVPTIETVFSQCRNRRLKLVEESLNQGFNVNAEDENGNTLLVVACQQTNLKMAEMLLARGANVNHRNQRGNTPLHYAMAYDREGTIGEFLIEKGADDTIENKDGLSPYDGLAAED